MRELTKEQLMHREQLWHETQKPLILDYFKSINKRLWKVLSSKEIKNVEEIQSMYFWGKAGNGKTTLAAMTLLEWHLQNFLKRKNKLTYHFVTSNQIIEHSKKEMFEKGAYNQPFLNKCKNVEFLIFDDLGVNKVSEWVYETFCSLIFHRYDMLKITIFTSNHSIEELAAKLKDDRIPSRIQHQCESRIFNLENKSYRN